MTVSNDIAAPPAKTPRSVKWVAAIGIPISLAAAAAVSFAGLAELGTFAGIDHPWLMPVAIDVYATTATLIAMLLPEGHRARRTAVWNARLGLAMSMSGNAVARALHLGTRGYSTSDAILTFIGAWPSFIVERLLHLQGHLTVADSATAPADEEPPLAPPLAPPVEVEQRHPQAPPDTATGVTDGAPETATAGATQAPLTSATSAPQPPPRSATGKGATATRKRHSTGGTVTDMGASGGLSLPEWAERAAPVYLELMERNGEAPSAPKLMAELVQRGNPAVGPARARLVRKATEDRLGLTKDPDEEPEPGDDEIEEAS